MQKILHSVWLKIFPRKSYSGKMHAILCRTCNKLLQLNLSSSKNDHQICEKSRLTSYKISQGEKGILHTESLSQGEKRAHLNMFVSEKSSHVSIHFASLLRCPHPPPKYNPVSCTHTV